MAHVEFRRRDLVWILLAATCGYSSILSGRKLFQPITQPDNPNQTKQLTELIKDFAGADTLRLMQVYNDFYPTVIWSMPDAVEAAEAQIKTIISKDIKNPNTVWGQNEIYKKHLHRLRAIPYLIACHQYHLCDHEKERERKQKLASRIHEGLEKHDPAVQEIILQNLISTVTASQHYQTSSLKKWLLFDDERTLRIVEKLIILALTDPQHFSILNPATIYLINMRRLCWSRGDVKKVTQINDTLKFLSKGISEDAFHVATIAKIMEPSTSWAPSRLYGAANMSSMLRQPTESLLRWRSLSKSGVNIDYLAWLALDRCRHFYRCYMASNFGSIPAAVSKQDPYQFQGWKLLGVLRDFGIYNGLVKPAIERNTYVSLQNEDPKFFKFVKDDLKEIVDDEAEQFNGENYSSEHIEASLASEYWENRGINSFGTVPRSTLQNLVQAVSEKPDDAAALAACLTTTLTAGLSYFQDVRERKQRILQERKDSKHRDQQEKYIKRLEDILKDQTEKNDNNFRELSANISAIRKGIREGIEANSVEIKKIRQEMEEGATIQCDARDE